MINFTTEYLWSKLNPQEDIELQYAIDVIRPMQQILQTQPSPALILENIPKATIYQLNDFVWLPSQLENFKNNNLVITYDAEQAFYINLLVDQHEKILRLGPFPPKKTPTWQKWLILLLSYIALALLLALWVRPLWLDLQLLTQMTSQIARGELDAVIINTKHSVISPLVNTMHLMANKIIRLVSDQKQLVNAVSHELRTPIARLRFAFAILDNVDEYQKKEINNDLAEMEQLINEMLSYARLESQEAGLVKQPYDINTLLASQINKIQRQCSHEIIFKPSSFALNDINPQYMERAFQNILTNAIRYTKSTVLVTVIQTSDSAIVYIDDDGPGISPNQRQHIFTPFHTLDESRSKKSTGFGLGLAIVKRIIDWHGATCEITDSPMKGCRFIVTIPKSVKNQMNTN